jgi:hypothetical protein
MLTPESINLSKLPAVSLAERKQLPQTAGIYFVINSLETVQYIGRSTNLRKRWLQHHCQGYLANGGRIAYLEVSEATLLPKIDTNKNLFLKRLPNLILSLGAVLKFATRINFRSQQNWLFIT